jgi:hypothetical protein
MQADDVIVFAFLAFLVIGGALLALSVRRGRALCVELARRFPVEYEELGQPRPGFFDSARRNAYMRFVMQRQFTLLGDPYLIEQFGALRRSEIRHLVFLLGGFGVLGAAALWYEFLRGA